MTDVPSFTFLSFNTQDLDNGNFDIALERIPVHDHDKIMRFKFEKDRRLALGSYLLRWYYACHVLGLPRKDVVFDTLAFGKPCLRLMEERWVDFNLSHDGHWVILGGTVVPNHRVGVDVVDMTQSIGGVDDFIVAFEPQLTEREKSLLRNRTGSQRQRTFFQIWALKESYIKATGQGLSLDLGQLCLFPEKVTSRGTNEEGDSKGCSRWRISLHGKDQKDWWVYLGDLDEQTIVAVSLDHHKECTSIPCFHQPSQVMLGDPPSLEVPLFHRLTLNQLTQ